MRNLKSFLSGIMVEELGDVAQAALYCPFGELIYEENAFWMLDTIPRYLFNGKERDQESNLDYYEARYYSSDAATFQSRDPHFEDYPTWSPYAYCMNNPVKYIDPDGRTVYITGDAAGEAASTLTTKNISVTRNEETGRLSVEGKAKNRDERLLVKAINSTTVRVNITANNSNEIGRDENNRKMTTGGGSFMGNTTYKGLPDYRGTIGGQSKESGFAIAEQYVSMDALKENFNTKDFGALIRHEITEGYIGGLISLKTGVDAGRSRTSPTSNLDPIYKKAHRRASSCPTPKSKEVDNSTRDTSTLPSLPLLTPWKF